jgi:hypothetical protein
MYVDHVMVLHLYCQLTPITLTPPTLTLVTLTALPPPPRIASIVSSFSSLSLTSTQLASPYTDSRI